MLLLGLMLISIARENDRDRVRLIAPFLILALPILAFQINRFPAQVDWSHPTLYVAGALLAAVTAVGVTLMRGSWRKALGWA